MDKKELKQIINEEKEMYLGSQYLRSKRNCSKRYLIWRYLAYYRKTQYHSMCLKQKKGISKLFSKTLYNYCVRKKNILSGKCGVEISNDRKLGRRLDIWHSGVVINCNLGDNCVFHGNNIIGNKGLDRSNEFPELGNGVDIGAGAVIIGKIQIADNCIIGANAVVTKSFLSPCSIIVGIPAKQLL